MGLDAEQKLAEKQRIYKHFGVDTKLLDIQRGAWGFKEAEPTKNPRWDSDDFWEQVKSRRQDSSDYIPLDTIRGGGSVIKVRFAGTTETSYLEHFRHSGTKGYWQANHNNDHASWVHGLPPFSGWERVTRRYQIDVRHSIKVQVVELPNADLNQPNNNIPESNFPNRLALVVAIGVDPKTDHPLQFTDEVERDENYQRALVNHPLVSEYQRRRFIEDTGKKSLAERIDDYAKLESLIGKSVRFDRYTSFDEGLDINSILAGIQSLGGERYSPRFPGLNRDEYAHLALQTVNYRDFMAAPFRPWGVFLGDSEVGNFDKFLAEYIADGGFDRIPLLDQAKQRGLLTARVDTSRANWQKVEKA